MREAKTITLQDGERKFTFTIKPMSALKAERWLIRAAFALGGGLSSLTKDADATEIVKALSSVDYDKVAPLWDELLSCCEIVQGGATIPVDADTLDGKIDYPTTVFLLKAAAVQANFGFFGKGGFSNFLSTMRGVLTS